MPEKQLRLLDPPTRFCSRPGARRSVKRKIARSSRPQQFSETWALLRSSKPKRTFLSCSIASGYAVTRITVGVPCAFPDTTWKDCPNLRAHTRHIAAPATAGT